MATGSNNAYRLTKLLVDGGTFLARELLLKLLVDRLRFNSMDVFLNSPPIRTIIRGLQKRNILKMDQIDILYPQKSSVEVEKLDITLLTCVLMNCCQLTPVETTVVQKLREFRNILHGHSPAFTIGEILFQQKWKEISDFLLQETKSNLKPQCEKSIETLIKCTESEVITQSMGEKYIKELLAWSREQIEGIIGNIENKVTDIQERLKQLLQQDNEYKPSFVQYHGPDEDQIISTRKYIKRIAKINEKARAIPSETLGYLVNALRHKRFIVLKGLPGSGKTFLGLTILREISRKGYKPVMIETLAQLEKLLYNEKRFVVLVDDFLGQCSVREHETEKLNQFPDVLSNLLKNSQSLIVFTIRSKIFNMSKSEKILSASLFEVNDAIFHTRNLLLFYARRKSIKLSSEMIDRLCNVESVTVGFPLLCKHMKGDSDEIRALFTKPMKIIESELDYNFRQKTCEFGLLLLVLLSKNSLDIQDPRSYTEKLNMIRTIFLTVPETRDELLAVAKCLVGTYLQSDGRLFSIVQDFILESLFKVAITHEPTLILYTPLEYIKEFSNFLLQKDKSWRHFLQRYLEEKEKCELSKCSLWKSYGFINFVLQDQGALFFFLPSSSDTRTLFEDLCEYVPPHIVEDIIFKTPTYILTKCRVIMARAMKRACLLGRISIVKSFVTVAKLPVTDDLVISGIIPKNSVEMTEFLLQYGGNVMARSADKVNLLECAASNKKYDVVKFILHKYTKEFDILLEELDNTLKLELILKLDLKKYVKTFLKRVQSQKYFDDKHLIHIAAEIGKVETLRIIVNEIEEDLKEEDKNGFNALHFAARSNSKKNLQYLIRKGISPVSETRDGINILDISAFKGHVELLEFITRKYMNNHFLNQSNRFGYNALHFAASGNSARCLEILIQSGFKPDSSTSSGNSILHIAVERNNFELVEYILKWHFELVNHQNALGQKPYDLVQGNLHLKHLFTKYDEASFSKQQTDYPNKNQMSVAYRRDETWEQDDSDKFSNVSVQTEESSFDLLRDTYGSPYPYLSQRTEERFSGQGLRDNQSQPTDQFDIQINTSESRRFTSHQFRFSKWCSCCCNEQ